MACSTMSLSPVSYTSDTVLLYSALSTGIIEFSCPSVCRSLCVCVCVCVCLCRR